MVSQPALASCPGFSWAEVGAGKTYATINLAVADVVAGLAPPRICVYDNGLGGGVCQNGDYDESIVVPASVTIELAAATIQTCIRNQTTGGQPALRFEGGTVSSPNKVHDFDWIWADGVDSDGIQVDDGALYVTNVGTIAGTTSVAVPPVPPVCTWSFHIRPAIAPEAAAMRLTGTASVSSYNNSYGEGCHGVVAEDESHFDSLHDDFDGCAGWPTLFRDTSTADIHRGKWTFNTTHIGGIVGIQPSSTPRVAITDGGFNRNPPTVGSSSGVEGFVIDGDAMSPWPVSATLFNTLWHSNTVWSKYNYQSGLISLHGNSYADVQSATMADNEAWTHFKLDDSASVYFDDSIISHNSDHTTDDPATKTFNEAYYAFVSNSVGSCAVDEVGWYYVARGEMGSGGLCPPADEENTDPSYADCGGLGGPKYCLHQTTSYMVDRSLESVPFFFSSGSYFTDPATMPATDTWDLDFGFHRWP